MGYLLASCHLTFLANGPVAWVEEVMVHETHRRSGVGRELMGCAEDWAREMGAVDLALASRRAGSFYRALGYEDSAVFFQEEPGGGLRRRVGAARRPMEGSGEGGLDAVARPVGIVLARTP